MDKTFSNFESNNLDDEHYLERRLRRLEEMIEKAEIRGLGLEDKVAPLHAQLTQLRNEVEACVNYVVREIGPKVEAQNKSSEINPSDNVLIQDLQARLGSTAQAIQAVKKQFEEKFTQIFNQTEHLRKGQHAAQEKLQNAIAPHFENVQEKIQELERQKTQIKREFEEKLIWMTHQIEQIREISHEGYAKLKVALNPKFETIETKLAEAERVLEKIQETNQGLQSAQEAFKKQTESSFEEAQEKEKLKFDVQEKALQALALQSEAALRELRSQIETKLEEAALHIQQVSKKEDAANLELQSAVDLKIQKMMLRLEDFQKEEKNLEQRVAASMHQQVLELEQKFLHLQKNLNLSCENFDKTKPQLEYVIVENQNLKNDMKDLLAKVSQEFETQKNSLEKTIQDLRFQLQTKQKGYQEILDSKIEALQEHEKNHGEQLRQFLEVWERNAAQLQKSLEDKTFEKLFHSEAWSTLLTQMSVHFQRWEDQMKRFGEKTERKVASGLTGKLFFGFILLLLLTGAAGLGWGIFLGRKVTDRLERVADEKVQAQFQEEKFRKQVEQSLKKQAPAVLQKEAASEVKKLQKDVQSRVDTAQAFLQQAQFQYQKLTTDLSDELSEMRKRKAAEAITTYVPTAAEPEVAPVKVSATPRLKTGSQSETSQNSASQNTSQSSDKSAFRKPRVFIS